MICHAYNCIFVHQRKCAGISIIRAFGLDPSIPDWHFMNDGALSAEYTLAPPGYFRPWKIDLSSVKDSLRDKPLYIRTKFFSSQYRRPTRLF